jgi:hypothetical protein
MAKNNGHQHSPSNFDFHDFERLIVFLRSRQIKKYPYFVHHKSSKKAINHGQNATSATPNTNKLTTQPILSNDGCLRDELLSPPSRQQNCDGPTTIRALIRLHPSPDTHPSRSLHQSNANHNM